MTRRAWWSSGSWFLVFHSSSLALSSQTCALLCYNGKQSRLRRCASWSGPVAILPTGCERPLRATDGRMSSGTTSRCWNRRAGQNEFMVRARLTRSAWVHDRWVHARRVDGRPAQVLASPGTAGRVLGRGSAGRRGVVRAQDHRKRLQRAVCNRGTALSGTRRLIPRILLGRV